MSVALGLFRLQQVDSRISQTEARLRKIQQTLENDAELQAALEKLKVAEQESRRKEQERRLAEEGVREQEIKIQQVESSLYGGGVHNPKELQDLQADSISLKKHLAQLEEQELDAMVNLEASQAAIQAARAELDRVQSRLGEEHRKLFDEQAASTRALQDFHTERAAAISSIPADLLSAYENLREQRAGVAVAEISDNACSACGANLTAALQQNARHAAVPVYCPSCGRILYAG